MLRYASALAAMLFLAITPAAATEAGWALLRQGGQIVLLVHANAPGSGDPTHFDIDNCRTQRNLSERGRQQARRIGALFAARAEPVEKVYSSRYCRALDTARLAFGERLVEPADALNQLPQDPEAAKAAEGAVLELIRNYDGSGNMVLVTHAENVAAFVGTTPREGTAIIVEQQDDGLRQIGRIVFN